jgi:hypothetical protein
MSSKTVLREGLLTKRADGDGIIVLPWNYGLLDGSHLRFIPGQGRPQIARGGVRFFQGGRIRKQLRQPGESRLQPAGLQILLIDHFPAHFAEEVEVIALEPGVIIIARATFIARLAHATPQPADGFMLCRAGKLHLIHGVLLTEELTAVSTVDLPVHST